MYETFDAIAVAAIVRNTCESVLNDEFGHGFQRAPHVDRDDVRPPHHDVADDQITEMKYLVDDFLLVPLDLAFLVPDFGERANLLRDHERSLLEPLTRKQAIRETDQGTRRNREREAEQPDERREGQRDT